MKTILKIILALSLVSSVLFGADEYSEQKEKIVAKILEHFGDNLIIPSKCENKEGCDNYADFVSFEKFPNELKKYFIDSFLNTFKNNQNLIIIQDVCYFYFPKQVEDYAFKCQKSDCKIEDVYTTTCCVSGGDRCKVTKSLFDYKNNMKIQKQRYKAFTSKLNKYSKKFKVSKEFFETFKETKKPLGEYFSADLKKCKKAEEYAKYEFYGDEAYYTPYFDEEKSLIILNGDLAYWYLIFDCNSGKCEIIDINDYEKSDAHAHPDTNHWLKEKCNKK